MAVDLTAVPDLLAGVGRLRRDGRPFLVGFAAEVAGGATLAQRAGAKLREKGCDAVVANDVSAPGIGFDADDNAVTVLFAQGAPVEIARAPKRAVADRLWDLFAPRLPPAPRLRSWPWLTPGSRPARRRRPATWPRPGRCWSRARRPRAATRGPFPPWPGATEPDFHATLAAVWIWARHQRLSRIEKFAAARQSAWTFLIEAAPRFIPAVIDPAAGDEAAFDCAMLLWAVAAEQPLGRLDAARQALAARAARVLSAHLGALEDLSGREFRDPGFLVLAVLEYARTFDDRGLLAAGQKFVDRAFGMRPPGPVAREPEAAGGLFDFSSTTATRILAVMTAEGSTPFVGAWLRERIAATVPSGFTPRRLDENAWNASVAWALGRAYAVSTDPAFSGRVHGHRRRARPARYGSRRRHRPRRRDGGRRGDADFLLRAGGRRAGRRRGACELDQPDG